MSCGSSCRPNCMVLCTDDMRTFSTKEMLVRRGPYWPRTHTPRVRASLEIHDCIRVSLMFLSIRCRFSFVDRKCQLLEFVEAEQTQLSAYSSTVPSVAVVGNHSVSSSCTNLILHEFDVACDTVTDHVSAKFQDATASYYFLMSVPGLRVFLF